MALRWPNKRPEEVFVNGADWSAVLDGATVSAAAAEVLDGDVVITSPASTTMDGSIQRVWVSGGTGGRQRIELTVTLSDGRLLQEVASFSIVT